MAMTMLSENRKLRELSSAYAGMLTEEKKAKAEKTEEDAEKSGERAETAKGEGKIQGKEVLRIEGFIGSLEDREVDELPGKLQIKAHVSYSKKTDSYSVGDERLMLRICKAVNSVIEDGVGEAVGSKKVEYTHNTAGLITGFRIKE